MGRREESCKKRYQESLGRGGWSGGLMILDGVGKGRKKEGRVRGGTGSSKEKRAAVRGCGCGCWCWCDGGWCLGWEGEAESRLTMWTYRSGSTLLRYGRSARGRVPWRE
ncbi:hypothetical protein CGRA01v4_07513 [Colletotrichum graminicola]|nr:hypothetical protein CGRA01v4_07513 [Colletotrichum graminicola]